jgi:hypothetical protein
LSPGRRTNRKNPKAVKERFSSTLLNYFINEKPRIVSGCIFNRVQPVHRPVTGFGAAANSIFR